MAENVEEELPRLGRVFPNFFAVTTQGSIDFHEWLGGTWAVFFSHPTDFNPVATSEMARVLQLQPEFAKRSCKLIALSSNDVFDHEQWIKDIESYEEKISGSHPKHLSFPIIADDEKLIATQLGMLDPDEEDDQGMPLPARAVYIIGPDRTLKVSLLYPASTGRNFFEILRALDALQLTAKMEVTTPVDWHTGQKCVIPANIPELEAKRLFPDHETISLPSGKDYFRITTIPRGCLCCDQDG